MEKSNTKDFQITNENAYGIVESVNIILDCRMAKYIFNVINSYNITVTSVINTFHDNF